MSDYRIRLSVPALVGRELEYLTRCIDTNYVSSVGGYVEEFERSMADFVGTQHAVACSSGTAALHLALLAAGVAPGDEVWVSDLTFIASANPARYCGAQVSLIDSELTTWNLDPEIVVDELEARARAGRLPAVIVPVHVLGHPAALDRIVHAAAQFDVPVVEDAAEALGARWTKGELAGRAVGTVGLAGCLSFNGNKIITTGGGGMVVTDDPHLAEVARHLSTQARLPVISYEHDRIGFNYRLSNLGAAVGLAQLEQLPTFVGARHAIAARYDAAFANAGDVTLPPNAPWAERSSWLYSILLADRQQRERVRKTLEREGIEARPVWLPVHRQRPYAEAPVLGGGRVADQIADRGLSLPSSSTLDEGEQREVIDVVNVALATG